MDWIPEIGVHCPNDRILRNSDTASLNLLLNDYHIRQIMSVEYLISYYLFFVILVNCNFCFFAISLALILLTCSHHFKFEFRADCDKSPFMRGLSNIARHNTNSRFPKGCMILAYLTGSKKTMIIRNTRLLCPQRQNRFGIVDGTKQTFIKSQKKLTPH